MNNYWAFLPMRSSNDLLGDADALQARLEEDSYLLFRKVLDPDKVLHLRRVVLEELAGVGWVRGGDDLMEAIAPGLPCREGEPEFLRGYERVQRLEAFHALAHDDGLVRVMREVVGPSAFPHPLKIARLAFPEHYEISTPPHQDFPNNQGSPSLTAAWMPLGDCPMQMGGLAVLRGSHRYGVLELDWSLAAGSRCAVIPDEMAEELRWVTTDYEVGDVLVFPSLTVHAALHNCSDFNMRVSVDFRYQVEGEALTPIVLEPHFQTLTWEDVYADWSSDELKYYWRDLDYRVEEFRTFPLTEGAGTTQTDDLQTKYFQGINRRRDRRATRIASADAQAQRSLRHRLISRLAR